MDILATLFTISLILVVFNGQTVVGSTANSRVDSITPKLASRNGGTRITIKGSGFSKNQFNFGDNPLLGNLVKLVSRTSQYECDIHRDGCTETQVTCYNQVCKAMPEGEWFVRVSVDGEKIPDNNLCGNPWSSTCSIKVQDNITPKVYSLSPRTALPGAMVSVRGKIFTDIYATNETVASNNRKARVIRSYMGGKTCELRDPVADDYYHLSLDMNHAGTAYTDNGRLDCKLTGTYVGNQNYSFMLNEEFGRSMPNPGVLWVNSLNKIGSFQTYAEVTGVSPSVGSVIGGTLLTVSGNYFDNTDAPVDVKIGGVPCDVQEFDDNQITCKVAPEPEISSFQPGNRGWTLHKWNSTDLYGLVDLAEIGNITDVPVATVHNDDFLWEDLMGEEGEMDSYVSRSQAYFMAPSDNEYKFFMLSDDEAQLWFLDPESDDNKTLIASTPSAKSAYIDDSQQSQRMTLVGGKSYLLEVYHRERTGHAYIRVGVHMYNTVYNGDQATPVKNERQLIDISTVIQQEQQTITFAGMTTQEATDEIQVINILAADTSAAKFRLGMYGAYTAALSVSVSASDLRSALNLLPSIAPESVTVTAQDISGGRQFTVNIRTKRGAWPSFTWLQDPTSPLPVTGQLVSSTAGVPSLQSVVLSFDGTPTPTIKSTGASANDVQSALTSLFSVRCPRTMTSPPGRAYHQSYEAPTTYHENGARVSDVQPLCGRTSLKNPTYMYWWKDDMPKINVFSYQYLCFGYLGSLQPYLQIKHSISPPAWVTFNVDFPTADTWQYKCVNLATLFSERYPHFTERDLAIINVLKNGTEDLYIDEVYIGSNPPTDDPDFVEYQRLTPSEWIGQKVTVTSPEAGTYNVGLDVYDCHHNLPLIEVEHAQAQGGATNNQAVYSGQGWASGASVTVTRTQAVSPPATGSFSVTYKGQQVTGLAADLEPEDLQARLESLPGVGQLLVTREGSCYGYKWTAEWASVPGDQPQMELDASGVSGNSVNVSLTTTQNGGIFFDPIPGDMLRTAHSNAQVTVAINRIPSVCSGDCGYTWDDGSTATVTGVTPASGSQSAGTSLTITGTGFSSTPSSNNVTIGGVACDVTAATTTEIQCDIGEGPAGVHNVYVYVTPNGLARHNPDTFNFTYTFAVSGLSPSSGGLGGGTPLVISGTGYGDLVTVTVGGEDCPIISSEYDSLTCTTPAVSAAGSASVVVTEGDEVLTASDSFTYDNALTASITSLSLTQASVAGGEVLTITGTGFEAPASSTTTLSLGSVAVETTSVSDTEIVATLPSLPPGTYPLRVLVGPNGYAVDSSSGSVPSLDYTLSVTSLSPTRGSRYGGTKLTVTGAGFGTDEDLVVVTVGDTTCGVDSLTDTEVVCTLAETGVTHVVTNQGSHPVYKVGYAWAPQTPQITVGDRVRWEWTTEALVEGVGYRVERTATPDAKEYAGTGFRSGETKTRNGVYESRFSSPGTYYYWSDYVDDTGLITMRGVITVVAAETTSSVLSVTVAGQEALYDTAGGAARRRRRSVSCPAVPTDAGCDGSATNSTSEKFEIQFETCLGATITDISPTSATADADITITGTGFGPETCQNEVTIGGYACVVSSATTTEIVCSLDHEDEMQIGVPYSVSVDVLDRGKALVDIANDADQKFTLQPQVSSVSPSSGSVKGGTELVITGTGFRVDGTGVQVSYYSCDITSLNYTHIVCLTGSAMEISEDVTVTVFSLGNFVPAECESSCAFSYADADTPDITDIQPRTITSAGEILTISGTGFSDVSENNVLLVGDTPCTIQSATSTSLTCDAGEPIAGAQTVSLHVANKGYATKDVTSVTVTPGTPTLSISSGSLGGGTDLTISGLGFASDSTATVGGTNCEVDSVTATSIVCSTPTGSAGDAAVLVTSNSVTYSGVMFTYDAAMTPTIASVSPNSGSEGDSISITATDMETDTSLVKVTVGTTACTVTAATSTSVTCTLGAHSAGDYPVSVRVDNQGYATGSVTFTYDLEASAISPTSGSYGGGQVVTVTGRGFETDLTNVTVCDEPCTAVTVASSTQLTCVTPLNSGSGGTPCDVSVATAAASSTLTTGYTYDGALTPQVSGVAPRRGGTGGGTSITITGSGYGLDPANIAVTIAGSACVVDSVMDTKIICTTAEHKPSTKASVEVKVGDDGIAQEASAGASSFEYIDVWSSPYTWGGSDPPVAGDFVVIPSDMKVLLDVDTPVLQILLIKGGQVVFDEVDVELHSKVILITEGGLLQVGTEDEPFQHQATIQLHGHPRDKELPLYGTKNIAVREGTLDLHGQPRTVRWSQLASTAAAGSSQITLQDSPDWVVGDVIAIASTGLRHSQAENEKRTITAVSGTTLTLDQPLEFEHRGETVTLTAGKVLEVRAEVGLLTHNVKVRGSDNDQWHDVIEECEEGFDTGEFVTQTCFQGRFGEETGSDQFGGHIIMHAPQPDEELVVGRIENVELTYMGQAFRLGRYAIHFHLNGDMHSSYVRGCSIHRSFNRAVNIHNTHYVTIEHNVIYDIMGGAFFLEDGVEIGNVFQYNLAIFVKSSTSLQNDDITPAAFWVTNANNTYIGNKAAGGTHFGWWYRMHDHPDGPSFDPNYCPKRIPMGLFRDNTVHSQGWFGIWIFEEMYPMADGGCASTTTSPAVFNSLIAYNNEKGAEWVGGGTLQFVDCIVVHNEKAGFEMKMMNHLHGTDFTEAGPMISNSLIVSHAGILDENTSGVGVIMPYSRGMLVKDSTFLNYDGSSVCFKGTQIDGTTQENSGGYGYVTEGLIFENSPNKILFRWHHDGHYHDLDGTLCGSADCKVIVNNPSLNPSKCSVVSNSGFSVNSNFPGATCDSSVSFHRMSFNHPHPASLESKNATFTTQYGTMYSPYKFKRKSHKQGWTVILANAETYTMGFENADQITNISYDATFYDFKGDDFVIIQQAFNQRAPDRIFVLANDDRNGSDSSLSNADNVNGDYFFNDADNELSYIVSAKDDRLVGQPRIDTVVALNAFTCFFPDCIPPPDPDTIPPASNRPDDAIIWHSDASWDGTESGWGGNNGDGTFSPPAEGTNVKIPEGVWMVVTEPIPTLHTLIVDGTLEFEFAPYENGSLRSFTLSATYIVIHGRFIAGWEDNVMRGSLDIVLLGDHSTEEYLLESGPSLGAKAMGVFGGLDLHGQPTVTSWTRVSATVGAGDTTITMETAVDWTAGDQVVFAPSRYSLDETEVRTIAAVSNDGLLITLTQGLQYSHYAHTEELSGSRSYKMSAEVGRLSRNIRVVGGSYDQQDQQAFGARVLVSAYYQGIDLRKGYARLSNVEFDRTGQEGWTDWYDPRYSLAFLNLGDITELKPSYVRSCAFHDGFAPAIGVFSTNLLEVSDTVIHNTVGSSIIVNGIGNSLLRNLVVKVIHPGVYNGREEFRDQWDGGIEVLKSSGTVMAGNTVAGSDRALYRVDGEPCDSAGLWSDNTGHSALAGVVIFPNEGIVPCTTVANFTIYRTFDYGIYTQSVASFKIINVVSIDNRLGLFPMVYSPAAAAHLFEDKFYELKDSTFIGTSGIMDCDDSLSGPNVDLSDQARCWTTETGGHVGVAFTTFSSGSNNAPEKPHCGIMAYQAINGIMRISGVTFANFRDTAGSKCNRRDTAITTNPKNDDAQHPIETSGLTLLNVDANSKVFIHRAQLGTINPSDCVDMECDGLKKAFIMDKDGSLLGGVGGTVVPESEWAWDSDPRRGLGDYRIPTHMLTDQNGDRIEVETIAPHKGIVRSPSCDYKDSYQAYVCPTSLRYAFLHLESMDSDTESRRLSPVGVLGNGYLDLINGPQDHGWCMGYTCQERLSTFPIMLASGISYDIAFTGTTPQDTRYHLLNTDDTFEVILSTWYAASWRLNVYAGGNYIMPTNGYLNDKDQLEVNEPQFDGQYMPRIGQDPTGTNYYDRETMTLHVLTTGKTIIDIKTDTTVLVTFNVPYMTVDEFFGERIVANLASFFDIPADKIKFANAVSESGRRKRTTITSFQVEIANTPPSTVDGSQSSDLTDDQIRALSASLINAYQLGLLGEVLNLTITSMQVQEPPPDTSSGDWNSYTQLDDLHDSVTLQIPDRMVLPQSPLPGSEGNTFLVPPKINMVDAKGILLNSVGTFLNPWKVRVSLEHYSGGQSDPRAVLGGTLERAFYNGVATFYDLTLSHSGRYKLHFSIVLPLTASFPDLVRDVEIRNREFSGKAVEQPDELNLRESFSMKVALIDTQNGGVAQEIDWKGHDWSCTPFLNSSVFMPDHLLGAQAVTVNPDTSTGTFQNLSLTGQGTYVVSIRCLTTPAAYDIFFQSETITVYPLGHQKPVKEVEKRVQLRFAGNYSDVAEGAESLVSAVVHNHLSEMYNNVTFSQFVISEGSVKVAFNVSGTEALVTSTLEDLYKQVQAGMTVVFVDYELVALGEMTVDGEPYHGVDQVNPGGLSTTLIIIIATCSAVAVVILILLLVWFLVIRPKSKAAPTNKRMMIHRHTVMVSDEEFGFSNEVMVKKKGDVDSGSCSSGVSSANSSSLNLRDGTSTSQSMARDGSATSRSIMIREGSATSRSGLVSSSLGSVSDVDATAATNAAIPPLDGAPSDDIFFGKRLPPIGLISKAKVAAKNGSPPKY